MSQGDAGPEMASSSLPNRWTADSWHISLALNNQIFPRHCLVDVILCGFYLDLSGLLVSQG